MSPNATPFRQLLGRIVRDATARLDAQTKALGAIDGALGIGGAS